MSNRISITVAAVAATLLYGCGGGGGSGTFPSVPSAAAPAPSAPAPGAPVAGDPGPSAPVPGAPSDYPVQLGKVGPIASDNPRQQPFACVTQQIGLGQPVVDNQNGIGLPVTDTNGKVVGYSADCGMAMRVDYFYRKVGAPNDNSNFTPYDPANPPNDVAAINVNGKDVKFIVRYERGSINRFLYGIAMLAPNPDPKNPGAIDSSAWNKDLVFQFIGGTGVGHTQAHIGNATRGLVNPAQQEQLPYLLQQGYAVALSSGMATSTTYNLMLTGQTASMIKQQFTAAYGKPRFTFGVGSSGGAVQQSIYAQNYPGLLDAAIPIQNFPDMITQFAPVGDCELLHYYFDKVDAQVNGTGVVNPKWTSWANRAWVTGLHAIDGFAKPTSAILPGTTTAVKGSDVCMEEWRGAIPMFMDPYWSQVSYADGSVKVLGAKGIASTFWGYFNDVVTVLTGDLSAKPSNTTPTTYDNEGVQYGLTALKAGKITVDEFLSLNAHVGGWKAGQDFLPEGFPYLGDGSNTSDWDPWSARNASAMSHASNPNDIAPRTVASPASLAAIQNAYKAGLVFRGKVDIPFIHIQPYLEAELNEHATREPFASRQRLIEARGNADNQVIWMTAAGDDDSKEAPIVQQALQAETQWLLTGSRPSSVQDQCYDSNGSVIASGPHVWDGQLSADGTQIVADTLNGGACTKQFPIYSDARLASGAPVSGSIFKCALKPVVSALHDGTYGGVFFSVAQEQRLLQIFATGVCDYSKPDQGRPAGI